MSSSIQEHAVGLDRHRTLEPHHCVSEAVLAPKLRQDVLADQVATLVSAAGVQVDRPDVTVAELHRRLPGVSLALTTEDSGALRGSRFEAGVSGRLHCRTPSSGVEKRAYRPTRHHNVDERQRLVRSSASVSIHIGRSTTVLHASGHVEFDPSRDGDQAGVPSSS